MDIIDLHRKAVANTGRIVSGVRTSQLSQPTPCPDFDVRTLLNHVIAGNYWCAGLLERGAAEFDSATDFVGDDPGNAFEISVKGLLDAARQPGVLARPVQLPWGESLGEAALSLHFTEAVAHGWDVAKATGQDTTIAPELAEPCLELARTSISEDYRKPEMKVFGPEIKIPADAPVQERLIGFLGRQP